MANKFGEEKANSRYLYRLVPEKAWQSKLSTKIAGPPEAGKMYLIPNTHKVSLTSREGRAVQ